MRLNMPSPAPHLRLLHWSCLESCSSGSPSSGSHRHLAQQGLSGAAGAGPDPQVWSVKG